MQVHHPALSPHHPLQLHNHHQPQPDLEPSIQQEQDKGETTQTTATEQSDSKHPTGMFYSFISIEFFYLVSSPSKRVCLSM